jgi:hypothetical protein|tara:strand:+ start:103 stop:522 length:420 start_codon:yes stop_codon:yes gene_type:complete
MGKLLQFPINRVVRSIPEAPELSEEEQEEIKKEKFIEQLTEQLSLDILSVFQENVVHLKSDLFLKDLALVIESIKSLLKRDFGKPHPMQSITDSFINIATTKEGRKLTDINYGKILKVKKAEVKEPEKSVSIDFDFDLE